MSVFFNGRLWTSPATMSVIDDTAMYNKNLSVGNVLAVIGKSEGGEPFKALSFGSPAEARAVLRSGESLKAIEKAFDPSEQTAGPSKVIFVRVNPATQSSLTLKDSSGNDVINIVSEGFGVFTNNIRVKVEGASLKGKKVSTQVGNDYYTADNVYRDAFIVQYTGSAATATIDIDAGSVTLKVAGSSDVVIDLMDNTTIGQVVDRISAEMNFTASVLDGNVEKPALNGLDFVVGQNIKTAFTATGNLQAIVEWINGTGEGFITAARATDAGTLPVNIPYLFLSGATNGQVTLAEWQAAFDVLQREDVQFVSVISPMPALHAMTDSHCAYMSNIARLERRAIVGGNKGASDDDAIAAAKNLNSDRTSYVHLGFYDYDSNGKLVLYPPYVMAAMLAGMFTGVNPGTALTNKSLKVRGLERKLRNPTDTDKLIDGGVLCVEDTVKGYKVVKSITTWLINDNYNRVEVSVGVACDFVSRNVRDILDDLRGAKGSPALLTEAVSRTDTTLRELAKAEPAGPGIIVGDKLNPAYKNIIASLEGDVLRVEFQCSPVIPCNFIAVVIHAVPYSGSASA
jgi:hypothetical protein